MVITKLFSSFFSGFANCFLLVVNRILKQQKAEGDTAEVLRSL